MSTYEQTPGNLNLVFSRGDDFSASLDADISMTGYTVTANIVSLVSGGTVAAFTTSLQSPPNGQFSISLSKTQTAAIPRGTYGWGVLWVGDGVTRTSVSGIVEVT